MNMKKILKAIVPACTAMAAVSAMTINAFAADAAATPSTGGSFASLILPLLFFFAIMYFFMIRPQKKKEKETKAMQDNIQVGDEIVTIGGIVGFVVRKGDDNVVIETGGEKNKMRIKLWAISENTSALERAKEAKDSAKSAAGVSAAKLKDDEAEEKKSKKKNKKSLDEE